MSFEKVYPAFYTSTLGEVCFYINADVFYQPEYDNWQESDTLDGHEDDIDVTKNHLSYAQGKAKSDEHVEFITSIAEREGFNVVNNGGLFFVFTNNSLMFSDREPRDSLSYRKVVIPMVEGQTGDDFDGFYDNAEVNDKIKEDILECLRGIESDYGYDVLNRGISWFDNYGNKIFIGVKKSK